TTQNGINGMLLTSRSNGNSIFLPAAGNRYDSDLGGGATYGRYRSSSLGTDRPYQARYLDFYSDNFGMDDGDYRCYGLSVRPVCVQSKKKRK
ncbi:MAG: hypothetical protein II815_03175, partial [Bacteroidales bacterium]|nr:hypothetical protein [Bacteroidales bacterium]